tara:strand:- start:230 stop:1276 length:1047 start_codon:yes stop_codon:yes gene_type:complete
MISNWKSPNASIKKIRLFITLVLTMMMMVTMLLFFASSSPNARFVSPSKNDDGAKTFSSKKSGFVLCKDDVVAQDGCFRFRKGTLTDPWKKEREMQTMDPDDLIRNEQLVEKIREGEMKQRKPTSRDVEDMRRARDAFDEFDASERKEREEKRARLRTRVSSNNRISGVKARVGEMSEAPKPHKSVPFRAVDGFMFGQLALAVYAFRKTRAPFAASLSALAFSGTVRALFTEKWRIVLFSGILGAFFGLFFLSMPIVEKLVDESVAKDLEDDGIDDDDSDDDGENDEESAAKENKGVHKIATYRQNFVQKNGVFVGKYSSSRRNKTSTSDSGSSNSTSTLQRVFAWMF